MIPYATQSIDESDLAAVKEVLTSGWLTQGPAVPSFEQAFVAQHRAGHAIAVSSATAGLHIACLALGVGPGKWVWTSPNSFVASANCALYCGAKVDFVDIEPTTRNMSVELLAAKLESAAVAGVLPQVVIPVHFAGLPCDLAGMRALADRYGFKLLVDASHAVGAEYQGEPVGASWADACVFSFHPVKIITSGEGGMVTTHDAELAKTIRQLRSHGIVRDSADLVFGSSADEPWYYEQVRLGFNYRMTDLEAALGESQLMRLAPFNAAREVLAGRYDHLLADLPLKLPTRLPNAKSSWHLYVVEIRPGRGIAGRATAFKRLRELGIGANVHYIPIHLQPFYRQLGFVPGQFPNAEAYYEQALSIPLYPDLTQSQQDQVVAALKQALRA